jgi:hypothetical protein
MSAFGSKADMTVCGNPLSQSLSGVKQTWLVAAHTSACDPKRTLVGVWTTGIWLQVKMNCLGTITKTWRELTRQPDPARVLDARCNLPISILTVVRVVLTVVRVVATNWSLERPLEVPERDQTCSSSGATVAATFILFPLKRRSLLPLKRRSWRVTEFPVW